METYDISVIVLLILSTITLVLVFVFNGLAAVGVDPFPNSVVNVSDTYTVDITPAGYTFAIWGIIYAWSALWTLYALINICRKNVKGPVLLNPVVLTIPCQCFWILSGISNIVWLVVWCQEQLFVSYLMISILTLSGYVAIGFHAIATVKHEMDIRKYSNYDYWLNYILIQNGMGCLFSWTTIASLVNLSIFLAYDMDVGPGMDVEGASLVGASILLVVVIVWSILENSVLFKYVRFFYVWYFVLLWAAIGVLVGNYDINNPNTVLTIVLICVGVVCLIAKIIVYKYRTKSPVQIDISEMEVKSSPL